MKTRIIHTSTYTTDARIQYIGLHGLLQALAAAAGLAVCMYKAAYPLKWPTQAFLPRIGQKITANFTISITVNYLLACTPTFLEKRGYTLTFCPPPTFKIAAPSSCLRLSVTSRCSTRTAVLLTYLFTYLLYVGITTSTVPHNSTGTLVSWRQRCPRNSTGVTPPYASAKCTWDGLRLVTFDK